MFERNDLEDLVSVEGVVHLATAPGVFLNINGNGRRVFLPALCMATLPQIFTRGETVTIQVLRWFAEKESLVS